MSRKGNQIRILMNQAFSANTHGRFDEAIQYYTQYLHSDYGRKDASAGYNAAIGYAYCKMYQHAFNEAIDVLLPVCLQGRFAIRRLTHLMLAYCYAALKNEPESNRYYEAYTQLIANDDRDEDRGYNDIEEEVDGNDDYNEISNDDEYEEDEDEEEDDDPDYDYDNADYEIDRNHGLDYGSWIRYATEEVFTIPGILQGWINFVGTNEQWLQATEKEKYHIASMLDEWADKAYIIELDKSTSAALKTEIKEIAIQCLDLSAAFDIKFKASSLYKKAERILKKDKNKARELFEESLSVDQEYTPSLLSLAQLCWLSNDNDKALELLEKYKNVFNKKNWKLGSSYFSLMASVYFSAGMQAADTGAYKKAEQLFREYLSLTQPHVVAFVNRPGNRPEDLWVALAEGYDLHNALPIVAPAEKLRRSLLFSDIAILENNSAKGFAAKANICCNANLWEDALACVEEALKREPAHAYSYYVKACTLSRMRAPEEQIYASVKKVIALDKQLAESMKIERDLEHLHSKPEFIDLFS